MTTNNSTSRIAETAANYFSNGLHCAETIVAVIIDNMEEAPPHRQTAISCATCFGGGFGKSFEETCGVISGAAIVIGLLYGRSQAGESWDYPAELIAEFREIFLTRHISTHCGNLRDKFGENQMQECQKLVMEGAVNLATILARENEQTNS